MARKRDIGLMVSVGISVTESVWLSRLFPETQSLGYRRWCDDGGKGKIGLMVSDGSARSSKKKSAAFPKTLTRLAPSQRRDHGGAVPGQRPGRRGRGGGLRRYRARPGG